MADSRLEYRQAKQSGESVVISLDRVEHTSKTLGVSPERSEQILGCNIDS
jgi:hypothetical protein